MLQKNTRYKISQRNEDTGLQEAYISS